MIRVKRTGVSNVEDGDAYRGSGETALPGERRSDVCMARQDGDHVVVLNRILKASHVAEIRRLIQLAGLLGVAKLIVPRKVGLVSHDEGATPIVDVLVSIIARKVETFPGIVAAALGVFLELGQRTCSGGESGSGPNSKSRVRGCGKRW
jgi:hypothetical protein